VQTTPSRIQKAIEKITRYFNANRNCPAMLTRPDSQAAELPGRSAAAVAKIPED
jgi:hypothetical protein